MKFMTSFLFTALFSLMIFNTASAQSLKSNMKSTQTLLKQIASTASSPSSNSDNAQNAAKMVTFFTAARAQSPDSGNFKDYQALMDQSIDLMKNLEAAFKNNDNTQALELLQKLNVAKKEGHDKYK